MKRRFSILTAALALLTFLAVPMGMWGQTRSVTYEPATSISAGDVVLLVAEGTNYKKELSGFSTSSTIYGTVADFTTAPAGVYPLTVVAGNSSGSFAFKNSENKYLSWSSGNSLQLSETLNNSSSWTFNYSYTVTTLTNVGTTSRQIKYNSSSPRFACYTSGQQSIKLYKQVTSSLLDSDLALTGAPVELSFDLYNNASAQTVSFTTSSTGAITVSQSDYITATVNANNKTITVSPIAVTNSTQTITVSQAATDTYDAGSVIFTVEVTDSTPTTIVTIDDSGITNTDVYVNTEAGSLSATVTSDGNTVSGATVIWSGNNNAVATINESTGAVTLVGVGAVTFTATYAGVSGQYVGSSATYEMTVTSSEPYEQPTTIEIIPNYTFWGKTGQFSGSTYDELSGSQDNVTLDWSRGSGSTYANLSAMRFYKDNNLTFTAPEGYEIVSIKLEVSGTYSDLTFSPTGYDNTTTTWTGSSATITMSRPSNASSYATISKFTITLAAIGNAVATTTTINVPANFNNDIYQGTTAGTLTATVSAEGTPISGATVTWESSNTGVATIDANGEVTLVTVGTTTITASYAGVEDEYRPSEGTYELTVIDSNAPGTQNNPYTVAQAIAAIDAGTGTQGVYATGIVSAIPTVWNTQYNNITFNFVDNAGDTDFLQAYRCVSGTGVDASTVAVGDIVVVHGNLTKYGSTYEFGQGCQLVSLIHPAVPSITVNPDEVNVDATPAAGEDFIEGTLDLTWENLEITDFFEDFAIQYYDAEGEELADDPNWIMVDLATQDPNIGEGYLVSYMIIEENEGTEARTAYFKVFALGDEDYVYSNLVTITQAAPVAPATGDEYALYTGELVEGDYLIVYDGGAMNTTVESDRLQYEDVTVNNDVIVTDNAAIVWHIAPSGQYWTIYNADAEAYAASTGAKNKAQMLADGTDDKALWTVSGTETYEFVNKKNTANNVNANLRKNGTYGFACYATSTGGALSLYKKVTHTLTVDAYTNDNTKDGYNLIASPVNVDPATVAGMTTGDFDLYSFDESQADEWRNYEATAFNLVPGKGYLYAKKATTENQTYSFELTGIPYNNEPIILSKSESGDFPGWNLVGNPFGETAVLSDNRDFYVMNSDGSDFIQGSGVIAPMQGIFVIAEEDDEVLQITVAGGTAIGPTEDSKLVLNLTKGRGIIDRAVVRFGEGRTLPKFMLNVDNTKLYITEGNQDYAVVRSNNAGEMPVSFKAAENGNYTLSIEAENVEASYLHLIDNMTGADVDLLATPSYSFEARTTDYANRFRLEFNTNGVEENNATANFAYFNGSSWTIDNMGEATLQVVDMMGRVISTETISGNTEVNLNQAAGVYMLRLVTGNDVKVQKVVVR